MSERLIELARRIQRHPWNADGADKTWVLTVLREHQRFQAEIRNAQRVDPTDAP